MAMRAIRGQTIVPLMGVPVSLVISLTFESAPAWRGRRDDVRMAFPVIDPYMGIIIGWKPYLPPWSGGIGNIRGAMIGGFILAAVEVFVAAYGSRLP